MILSRFAAFFFGIFLLVEKNSAFVTRHRDGSAGKGLSPISFLRTAPVGKLVATTSRRTLELSIFEKLFEETGALGKGITVGKVQVSLNCADRSRNSIIGNLEQCAQSSTQSTNAALARLTNEVCLALLRKSDDWAGACSASKWFSLKDTGKAESLFNDWANIEAAKFEKEYIPSFDKGGGTGGPTIAVVSLVIEIQGDTTKFDGAGFTMGGTKDVLSSIASDCTVDGGRCLNAVEVFWTPSESTEVLTQADIVVDFPELIDL